MDLITKLITSDHGKWKYVFAILKVLLTIVFAAKLYKLFFGPYEIISLTSEHYNQIIKFIISGKVLIPILLFLIIWGVFYGVFRIGLFFYYSYLGNILYREFINSAQFIANYIQISPWYFFKNFQINQGILVWEYRILFRIIFSLRILECNPEDQTEIYKGANFDGLFEFIKEVKTGNRSINTGILEECLLLILEAIFLYLLFYTTLATIWYKIIAALFLLFIIRNTLVVGLALIWAFNTNIDEITDYFVSLRIHLP